jgi:hypothetical protein
MAAAAAAELFEFQPLGRGFLVLRRYVVALFAFSALQNYVISWHYFNLFLSSESRFEAASSV